jgi:hypothetical protein
LLRQECLKKRVVKVTVKKTQVYEWNKRFRDGYETAGFFCKDKAPAYRSLVVTEYVAEHNVKASEHLPHSPDLSRLDFFLFPRLRSVIEGQRFAVA